MKLLRIGELSKASGTGIETIRFYEREGLLQVPERQPSGYRQYPQSTVSRLDYIRQAKTLGFTLGEIRELLELSSGGVCCQHIRLRAANKIADIESKIRNLQQMKRSLKQIVQECSHNGLPHNCPLVHKTQQPTDE